MKWKEISDQNRSTVDSFRSSRTKKHAAGDSRLPAEEESRGFAAEGVFTKRIRHMTDGVVIGSKEFVQHKLERLRDAGRYLRRRNPLSQLDEAHMSLRPQRAGV